MSTFRFDRRDQDVRQSPVKAIATHPERLPSYRAATTCAVGGCSVRIRPRRRTSRTRSPRHPPSVRVNGATQVPSWLGGSTLAVFRQRIGASRDACDRQMPNIRLRQAPTNRSATGTIELSPVISVCGALHGAPHASATCSRSLQEVFSPAVVALEQPTSDTSVTDLPRAEHAFAHRELHALSRLDDSTLSRTSSRNIGLDRAHCSFVKKEQLPRSEAPSIERRPTTSASLRMPS